MVLNLKVVAFFVTLLFCLSDAIERFGSNDLKGIQDGVSFELEDFKVNKLSSSDVNEILSLYAKEGASEGINVEVMSEEAQGKQNGLLETLAINDSVFHLKAIVIGKQNFALFRKSNVRQNTDEIVKLIDGEYISGYLLNIENPKSIQLVHGDRIVTMTMYKSKLLEAKE